MLRICFGDLIFDIGLALVDLYDEENNDGCDRQVSHHDHEVAEFRRVARKVDQDSMVKTVGHLELREVIKEILEEVKEGPSGYHPSHFSPYIKFVVHSSNFVNCVYIEEQKNPVESIKGQIVESH